MADNNEDEDVVVVLEFIGYSGTLNAELYKLDESNEDGLVVECEMLYANEPLGCIEVPG